MPVNNKIKIRRGNNIDLPAGGTESGELRYSIDTKELYIDDGSLNIKIGGDPYAFPVSSATQSALNGKQPAGTYSTDIHSNITALNDVLGSNHGDETTTSIKTKLGAATSVSDGYLKYQDFALLHTPTTVTAANGLSISGQNISLQNASLSQSGALTFNDWNTFNSKEPAITKNTGFNKNFGTTTGTVLEGRIFGTAASSAIGDFIQNQNASAQSANMWINGLTTLGSGTNSDARVRINNSTSGLSLIRAVGINGSIIIDNVGSGNNYFNAVQTHEFQINGVNKFRIDDTGAATFSSTVNSTGFLLNGNNLTSSLSTNYIPKWNGSSFVNSLISDDGSNVGIGTTTRDNGKLVILKNSVYNSYTGAGLSIQSNTANAYTELQLGADDNINIGYIQTLQKNTSYLTRSLSLNPNGGNVQIGYGADQGYKLAVNGTGIFSSSVTASSFIGSGSNLTGIQLPITLTTTGTSGAATFSGNVLNVPNYGVSGWVDQAQTTVNGSTSGTMVCSMPFQTGSYKKVLIALNGLNGSATYTFPSSFSRIPDAVGRGSSGLGIAALSTTSITITSTGSTGWCIIEGY